MTKTKRILFIASTFPSSKTDPIPAFVKDQIIAIKQYYPELDLSILAPHDNRSNTIPFSKHTDYDEYRFHYAWPHRLERLAGRGILPAIKNNPLNYLLIPSLFMGEFFALLRLTKKLQPDYLYAHWFTPQAVVASWVSSATGIPFVYTTHASDVEVWNKIPFIGKLVVRSVSKRASAITAVSKGSMKKLENFFSKESWKEVRKKTTIIPMGVNLNRRSNLTKTMEAELKNSYGLSGKKIILFIGRLAEKKGVRYLLESFVNLEKKDKEILLIIAGDGPLKKNLKDKASQLGITQAKFVGYVSGKEKQDYLDMSDVVVIPSIVTNNGDSEGLPVVLMEALVSGKICVATHESNAGDVIKNNVNGFLVKQKDADLLNNRLYTALRLTNKEKSAMQIKATEAGRQFDWKLIAKRHIEFFRW